jgi:dienelactone hydrolase
MSVPEKEAHAFIADAFECPRSRADFEAQRRRTLAALRDMLGTPPFVENPPLNPRIMYVADCGSHLRKKVRYGSEADDVVWAWLLIPKGLQEPRPAVICLPGSFVTPNYGKDGPAGLAGPENRGHPEAYGLDLARLGYVTICPDHPVAGERTTPGRASHDTTELDRRFPTWSRVGLSAWDVSRAVDFLLTVPEVDPRRIGCTGWSQGGQMALLGAALDTRIAAVAAVCGWSPLRGIGGDVAENNVASYNYPRLAPYLREKRKLPVDLDAVAASLAPRPFLDVRATRDEFFANVEVTRGAHREIACAYDLLGAGDRFEACWFPGEHAHNADAARETQAWFHRWLWKVRS